MTAPPAGKRGGISLSAAARQRPGPGRTRVRVRDDGLWSWRQRHLCAHLRPDRLAIGPGNLWLHLQGTGIKQRPGGVRERCRLSLTLWRFGMPANHWRQLLVAARWCAGHGMAESSR